MIVAHQAAMQQASALDQVTWDIQSQDIMTLPARAGSMPRWDANLIHWGALRNE